jgi:hypothetical protein
VQDGNVQRKESAVTGRRRCFQGLRVPVNKEPDLLRRPHLGRDVEREPPVVRGLLEGVGELVGEEIDPIVRRSSVDGLVKRQRPVVGPFLQGLLPFGHDEADDVHSRVPVDKKMEGQTSRPVPLLERPGSL